MQGLWQVIEGVLIIAMVCFHAKRIPLLVHSLGLYIVFKETWHRLKVLGDFIIILIVRFMHCVVDKGF